MACASSMQHDATSGTRIGLPLSVVLFGMPALALWLATRLLIPSLVAGGWQPLLAWFAAGLMIFVALFAAAVIAARKEGASTLPALLRRLRVRALRSRDWKVAGTAIAFTAAATAVLYVMNEELWPGLPPQPPFMQVQPLGAGQHYILLLWLPFFAFNIIGEELWWRGYIQTRQEPVFGAVTWIVQGFLHGAFHLSFGLGVLFILLPTIFAIPWAVQRSRNTSVGMVVHAGVNGPAFLAVSLGLLPS